MDEFQRQVRTSIVVFLIIIPLGTIGFNLLEGWSLVESFYATVITISTVGYGDFSPKSEGGFIFTSLLVIIGLGAFAYVAQATIGFVTSPHLRRFQQIKKTHKKIDRLANHYIICGEGEIVNKTIEYIRQASIQKRDYKIMRRSENFEMAINRFFGKAKIERGMRKMLRKTHRRFAEASTRMETLLDTIVVLTADHDYAVSLRNDGWLVIEGNPTDDDMLIAAGLVRAEAIMIMLDNDTETLLTVLSARSLDPSVRIVAAALDDNLSSKIARVGAKHVVTPYDIAGQFLNNITLRPAVSDFFDSVLFNPMADYRLAQLELRDDSPWIGKSLERLRLRQDYQAGVIGVRLDDASYSYAPDYNHVLQEDETLIVVAPTHQIPELKLDCRGERTRKNHLSLWQPLPRYQEPLKSDKTYTLAEAESTIAEMSKHFIICGADRIAERVVARLDPARPFVVISNNNTFTAELLKRGFRVVHGNPAYEETLLRAGVKKAQAIMVVMEEKEKANSVLAILNSRSLNKRLLITATAHNDMMIEKLRRAGADRVISPENVAARFILLSTIQPELAGFLGYVLYNYQTGLETTEIYMQGDSVWIGQTITELDLNGRFNAGIVGIRLGDRNTFEYAPPRDRVIGEDEVLIIITPMVHSDALRDDAHGGTQRAPETLRSSILTSTRWSQDDIRKMIERAKHNGGK